jgi:hypothetical protein
MGLFNKRSKNRPARGAIVNTEAYKTDPVYQEHNAGNGSGYVSITIPSSSEGERAFLTEMFESVGREAYGESFKEVAEILIVESDIGRFDVRTSDYRILFEKGQGKDFVKALKKGEYGKDIKLVKNSNAMLNQWTQVEDWNLNNGFYDPIGNGSRQEFAKYPKFAKAMDGLKGAGKKIKHGVSKFGKSTKNVISNHVPEALFIGGLGLMGASIVLLDLGFDHFYDTVHYNNFLYAVYGSEIVGGLSAVAGVAMYDLDNFE